jgi:GT2 family glycosyltransferase
LSGSPEGDHNIFKYYDSIVVREDKTEWYESRPIWSPILFEQLDFIGELVLIENINLETLVELLVLDYLNLVKTSINNLNLLKIRIPKSGYSINENKWVPMKIKNSRLDSNFKAIETLERTLSLIVPTKFTKENEIYYLNAFLDSVSKFINNSYIKEIILVHDKKYSSEFVDISIHFNQLNIVSVEYSGVFNFSRVLNLGIKNAAGKYLAILNDDILFTESINFMHVIEHLEYDGFDVIGFNLLYPNSLSLQHAGLEYRNREPQHYLKGSQISILDKINNPCRETSGSTGAFLVMGKSAFNKFGYFDEDFPNDFGDVEYMLRVKLQKGNIIICSVPGIHHFESISRGVSNLRDLNSKLKLLSKKYEYLPIRDDYLFTPFDFEL